VDNGQQAGFAENEVYFLTTSHAMLWSGTSVPVDLHPPATYPYSRAMGLKGGEQAGYISQVAYPCGETFAYHSTSHAYRWSGTAASGVDLHPARWDASEASATNGVQQGGWGYTALGASHLHALLWSGTPESAVDLHPAGYSDTRVRAMNATQQVGDGWTGGVAVPGSVQHALLWSDTAESVVDLNQYLPVGYTNGVATGIGDDGNIVGYAYNTPINYSLGLGIPSDAIAVVFAPGPTPASAVASLSLTPAAVAPGALVQGTVTLGGPAPAGGVTLSFLSTNTALGATPSSIVIPEGQNSAAFSLSALGSALTTPQTVKLYVTDGATSRVANLSVVPVVNLSSLNVNAVEGGFSTTGTVFLNIPAQGTASVVALTSGNPSLVSVQASVTVPSG
jgi:hypothetical protein